MGRCLSRNFTISNKIVTNQVIWMLSESQIRPCIPQNSNLNQNVTDFVCARTGEVGRTAPHGLQTSLSAPGDDFLTVANAAGDFEHLTLGISSGLDSAVYTLTGYR